MTVFLFMSRWFVKQDAVRYKVEVVASVDVDAIMRLPRRSSLPAPTAPLRCPPLGPAGGRAGAVTDRVSLHG